MYEYTYIYWLVDYLYWGKKVCEKRSCLFSAQQCSHCCGEMNIRGYNKVEVETTRINTETLHRMIFRMKLANMFWGNVAWVRHEETHRWVKIRILRLKYKHGDGGGQDGRVERPWAHLPPWIQQN